MLIMDPYNSIKADEFQTEKLILFGINELLEADQTDWGLIQKTFKTKPAQFELLLFKIHFKRKKSLPENKRSRILNFLSIGYLSTDDIRYFNEFLWFFNDNKIDKKLMDACKKRFNTNLNEKGCHRLPYQLNQNPVSTISSDLNQLGYENEAALKVCLIGFPPFFGTIIKTLRNEGHQVEQFFLPFHPNRYINRVLKFRLPVKILSFIAGNFYAYRTLNFNYKDEKIGQILREGNFDIGFHKLNLIIKENMFSAFKKGLLNDHWGYLPFLRGKSTIAYSLLLNVPVIPTIHLIDKGIDSGPIVGYYPCDYSKAKTVNEVRDVIRKKMPERAVAAIKLAGASGFKAKENIKEMGITFYEIHPWLNNHIASHILK